MSTPMMVTAVVMVFTGIGMWGVGVLHGFWTDDLTLHGTWLKIAVAGVVLIAVGAITGLAVDGAVR